MLHRLADAGPPRRRHPGRHARPCGPARRPVLPARAPPVARSVAAACRGARGRRDPELRAHAAPEFRAATAALADVRAALGCTVARRRCGRWSTPAWWSCSAVPPPTRSCRCCRLPVPASRCAPGSTTRRPGSVTGRAGIWSPECAVPPARRAAHGRRVSATCSSTSRPSSRPAAAPTAPGASATRRLLRPRPRADRPGVVCRAPATRAAPTTATSTTFDHGSGFRPRRGHRHRRPPQAAVRPETAAEEARRDAADFVAQVRGRLARRTSAGASRSGWSRGTPSCSATGGTRARCSSSTCCGCCPRPAYVSRRWRRSSRSSTSRRRGRPPGRLVGCREGPAAVGRRGRRRPRRPVARRRGQAAPRRTPGRAARLGARSRPRRPGPRGAAADGQRLGVHGVEGQCGVLRARPARGASRPVLALADASEAADRTPAVPAGPRGERRRPHLAHGRPLGLDESGRGAREESRPLRTEVPVSRLTPCSSSPPPSPRLP